MDMPMPDPAAPPAAPPVPAEVWTVWAVTCGQYLAADTGSGSPEAYAWFSTEAAAVAEAAFQTQAYGGMEYVALKVK